ncbi:hypothetical protein DIC82_15015 [Clostridium beijerinckii]|nr:hypothetical protein DIC82_15015 [Clostridium beijerinckii]
MSQWIQITLIICGTIIIVQFLGFLMIKSLWNKNNKPRKLQGYQGTRQPDTSSGEVITRIKPPSIGSGIK